MKFLLLFLAHLLQVKTGEGKLWFRSRKIVGTFSTPFVMCANCWKTNDYLINRNLCHDKIFIKVNFANANANAHAGHWQKLFQLITRCWISSSACYTWCSKPFLLNLQSNIATIILLSCTLGSCGTSIIDSIVLPCFTGEANIAINPNYKAKKTIIEGQ